MRQRTKPASALLIAALSASLLAAAAGLLLQQTKSARAASTETYRLERARLEANSLLETAVVRLDNGDPLPRRGVLFGDAEGRVSRQDATGLVDLNAAEPEQLQALFVALGLEPERGAMLADRIADWRDEDGLRRLNGAERNEYQGAGRDGPADAPFVFETELALVLGFDEALVRCAMPFITIYSGSPAIDTLGAPDLLQSLPYSNDGALGLDGPPFGRVVLLSGEAPISASAMLRLRRWVRLTGDPDRPFIIHRSAEDLVPVAAQSAPPHCNDEAAA
jgi:hypothetical protein